MTRSFFLLIAIVACLFLSTFETSAWEGYNTNNQIGQRLKKLSESYPQLIKVNSLTQTPGGNDLWLITIGTGQTEKHPALAVVGGVEGNYLIGVELSVRFAEQLLRRSNEPAIKELLAKRTFYIFPNVSPDGTEQFFKNPRFEKLGNGKVTDNDRDGKFNEDPFEDLNKDGLVTMLRVKDFSGDWMKLEQDERVMVKANIEKGEKGEYLMFTEGIDNDKDGKMNEEGDQGIVFNRNFTFDYQPFYQGAGEHAVSEPETRAIADFLFAAKNVFAVFSFGPVNNLSEPYQFNEREALARIPKGIQKEDVIINQLVSLKYNHLVSQKDAPKTNPGKGDFSQWAYFHYGRFSFSTPAWWLPAKISSKMPDRKQDLNPKLAFLNWAEEEKLENFFVPWTKIHHPDFPGKEVEVGGIVPYVLINPPFNMIEQISQEHSEFIIDLAKMAPEISATVTTENLGKDLYRITVEIINQGVFPTSSQIGSRLNWVRKPGVYFEVSSKQNLIQGMRVQVLESIPGRGKKELSWLVKGRGKIKITVGSEMTGIVIKDINL